MCARRLRVGAIVVAAALAAACAPEVDLAQHLQVVDLSTGWHDAGIVDGKNKLVPSATFKLKNNSDQTLPALQVNALFRRVNEPDEWGSAFLPVSGSEGLVPGATSNAVTVHSNRGYTGQEPRAAMMKNQAFVDAKVEVFAKYGSVQWKRLGEYPITRELLER